MRCQLNACSNGITVLAALEQPRPEVCPAEGKIVQHQNPLAGNAALEFVERPRQLGIAEAQVGQWPEGVPDLDGD